VFRDVAEPQLVRGIGGKDMPGRAVLVDHGAQVVVDGRPGFFALPRFGLPNADHQPSSEQIRHAVRSAIGSPAARASSTRNR
jgi:hypothetical protein